MLNGLVERAGVDVADVEDVICGNGIGVGDHGESIGRLSVLAAGWPIEVPGVTLNRFCGSGQQAVTFAAMGVRSGEQDLVIGCGVESMSRWPSADAPSTLDGGNPRLHRALSHGAAGNLSRPDRHAGGVQPRRGRRVRRPQPGARREGAGRWRLRAQRHCLSTTPTDRSRSPPTSSRAPGRPPSRLPA